MRPTDGSSSRREFQHVGLCPDATAVPVRHRAGGDGPGTGDSPGVLGGGQRQCAGRLPPGTVAGLLRGCDRSREAGLRDYAILLLLARPGLRAGEIAAIGFDDIGWADGTVLVHGKGGRRDLLPLGKGRTVPMPDGPRGRPCREPHTWRAC